MKHICLLTALFFCYSTFVSNSKNYSNFPIVKFKDHKNWKIEFQNSEIKVESAVINSTQPKDGISHELVIFRYTNLTQKNISLSFTRRSYYGNVCFGCDGKEPQFKIELKPGQSLEYSEGERNKLFYLFSKDLKGTIKKQLSKFEITNIVVQ